MADEAVTYDKLLLGGDLEIVGGSTNHHLVRSDSQGQLDVSFHADAAVPFTIRALAIQPDSKILAGGDRIVRLDPDGTLDATFSMASALDRFITCMVVQADGKIVAGTSYHNIGVVEPDVLVRFNADGTRDSAFHPVFGITSAVWALIVQPDQKLVVAGGFGSLNGLPVVNLVRLNTDGTVDPSFQAHVRSIPVIALATDASGRLLVGGGGPGSLVRLNADGSADDTFQAVTGLVSSITLLPDDRMLIAGQLGTVNDIPRSGVARLFTSNTAPLGISGVLRIGPTLRLSVSTVLAKRYVLECADSLVSPAWKTIQTTVGDARPAP